ncbi:MAG: tetratricopeptide repeat protein [Limisphaerales bacterium]
MTRNLRTWWCVAAVALASIPTDAQSSRSRSSRDGAATAASASLETDAAGYPKPIAFAPVPADHPLAGVWNDPDFARRLAGSYGFLSEAEPRLTVEEQVLFRDKIVPLLREDPAKAVPELRAAQKPGASAVFDFTLGTVYFQSEDFTNAVAQFELALAKFPDYRRAQRNLALALVRSGRYGEAIRPLARTIELGGADGKIFGLLGFAHLNEGRLVSAEAAYKQAMVFEPDTLDYQMGLVKCYIGLEEMDAAVALLDELIQRNPEKESLWALQANVFAQREQPAKAIVNLEILRKLDKADAPQLALLGDLYLVQESPDLALEAYLASVEKDGGKNPSRGLRAAEILVSRGGHTQARALAEKLRAVGVPAGEDEWRLLKVEARVALAEGRGEDGIRILETLTQRNPMDGEALLLAGDYLARDGQSEKAAFRYDAAAKISGFEPDAYLKQAQLKVSQQKYTEAVELLRRAQKFKPRDHVARYLEKVEQAANRARS